MSWPLVAAGFALGFAATPHCALMCGAPCAALTGGCRRSAIGFHAGRVAGYMAGGALAAGSMALLGAWSEAAPALRPLWTALHLGFLALGLWWLLGGRPLPGASAQTAGVPVRIVAARRPWRAGAAGLAWVAWPCGALQAALLLAALADDAAGGALVMAAFALGSMPGLAVAPWLWARVTALRDIAPARIAAFGRRLAGMGLVLGSGWALTHGLWARVAAWCVA